ncbi:hypothetical protein T190_28815 [Sinorhizobium meliloti CCBAU 01290]|nr:hypothetical protein T190_28815 [Sinorhizobium meliloti CCBAU 01290]
MGGTVKGTAMAATALRRQARLGKMVGGFFQDLFCPLVETLSRKLSSKSCSAMDFGSDTKHHLPRIGSLRLFADFPAGLEVVIDCLMEGFLEFSDTVTVKADYIGDTCNLPKNTSSSASNSMRA